MIISIIKGKKPTPGRYSFRGREELPVTNLKEEQIKNKKVEVMFPHLGKITIPFRSFHFYYKKL